MSESTQSPDKQTPSATPPANPPRMSPPTRPVEVQYAPRSDEGDATGGLIPYKNLPALFAYYLGIFSFIPLLGLAALVLGIVGLRLRARKPVVSGVVHAWIGIVLGSLSTAFYLLIMGLIIAGVAGWL
jgi:hypothetical protein